MGDLENFLHNDAIHVPILVRAAMAHYQFETIHPFNDGNGRVGRLLITLYLQSEGMLRKPLLYLSAFFDEHRSLYYDNLMRVRTHNAMLQWLLFFLQGVEQTAQSAHDTLVKVLALQKQLETWAHTLGKRSGTALAMGKVLFNMPIVYASELSAGIQLSLPTTYQLLALFEQAGYLQEITGRQRDKVYRFGPYLDLFA